MKASRFLLLLLASAPVFGHLAAQQVPPAPAFHSPLLSRVPAGQSWTVITFQGGSKLLEEILATGTDKPDGSAPRCCKIAKSGEIYKILDSATPGRETWVWRNMNLGKEAGKPLLRNIATTDEGGASYGYDFTRSDFPELDWLKTGYFKETANFQNKTVFVFEKPGNGGGVEKVWLDGGTQFPLLRQIGNLVILYQYSNGPDPEIPADVRKNFEEWHRAMTFLNKN